MCKFNQFTHFALKEHKDLRNVKEIDHSLLILRKNFENSDRSMYAICVGLGKFCSQFALFTEKFTQSTKFLRDHRSHRSRQISSLSHQSSGVYVQLNLPDGPGQVESSPAGGWLVGPSSSNCRGLLMVVIVMMLIVNCDDGCDGDSSDDGGDN